MPFLNSYVCPKCGRPFSYFIKPSIRINRGLLLPDLKCPNCGQISRQKIDVFSAAWVWPLTLGLFTAFTYVLRSFLYREAPILYILIVIMLFAPFFIGLRRGLKLVSVEKIHMRKSRSIKWVIPLGGIILYSLFWGYYTHDWLNVVLGFSTGMIVWAFFYYLSRRRVDKRDHTH
jgi:DNA-directed RNA polymerase subunit RPC12/RpoP